MIDCRLGALGWHRQAARPSLFHLAAGRVLPEAYAPATAPESFHETKRNANTLRSQGMIRFR